MIAFGSVKDETSLELETGAKIDGLSFKTMSPNNTAKSIDLSANMGHTRKQFFRRKQSREKVVQNDVISHYINHSSKP